MATNAKGTGELFRELMRVADGSPSSHTTESIRLIEEIVQGWTERRARALEEIRERQAELVATVQGVFEAVREQDIVPDELRKRMRQAVWGERDAHEQALAVLCLEESKLTTECEPPATPARIISKMLGGPREAACDLMSRGLVLESILKAEALETTVFTEPEVVVELLREGVAKSINRNRDARSNSAQFFHAVGFASTMRVPVRRPRSR